ncbi:hypothetical protein BDZ89DRAFT_1077446, partial [Hymenopellis radicata]
MPIVTKILVQPWTAPELLAIPLPLFWAPQNIAYMFRSLQTGPSSISRRAKTSPNRTCPLWEIVPKFFSSFLPLHL